jgi:hypothetical protein
MPASVCSGGSFAAALDEEDLRRPDHLRTTTPPRHGNALTAGPITRSKTGEPRPAIPRSMSCRDTGVSPRYSDGLTTGIRITAAEAFELEGMHASYVDIDGFWRTDGDNNGPESAPIANK